METIRRVFANNYKQGGRLVIFLVVQNIQVFYCHENCFNPYYFVQTSQLFHHLAKSLIFWIEKGRQAH